MELANTIDWVKTEIEKMPSELAWRQSMLDQLRYCSSVVAGTQDPSRLEQLSMGLIAARELEGASPPELAERIFSIQYQLQRERLPYAAKVRLGIHRST